MKKNYDAKNLKKLRLKKEMSQRLLSIKSGLSRGTIQMIEYGKASPKQETLQKLYYGLDLKVS